MFTNVLDTVIETCKTNADCKTSSTNCRRGRCLCLAGYIRDGDVCVSASKSELQYTYVLNQLNCVVTKTVVKRS